MNDQTEYRQQYETERSRLIQALGRLAEGGILESVQHIGATGVAGLYGSPCVDIALAAWPFPLEPGARAGVEALGYHALDGYEESPEQRFEHESGSFRLYFFEAGSGEWVDRVLTRDYLRHSPSVCDEISLKRQAGPVDKSRLFDELLPEARQWWIDHHGFSPVEAVVRELDAASFPWYIAGGWALDLFLGQVGRVHRDVDVAIPRAAQLEFRQHLTERGWQLMTPFEKRLEPWPPHMRLEPPRHQVHALREDDFVDFLLTDMDGVWRYRREPSVIRLPERASAETESGIRFLAPELVLLFKSKNTSNRARPMDEHDFERTLPRLDAERRAWLRWALSAASPDHPWIAKLT